MARRGESGAATIEHAGLTSLIAVLVLIALAALATSPAESGRELGATLARKLRCGAAGPGPCWRDPLTLAYGRSVAGAVRALAPAPAVDRGLLPVDFRRCRSASCALPGPGAGLTASNRRVTAFVSVSAGPDAEGGIEITYWLYRPTLGWDSEVRAVTSAEVAELAPTPLLEDAVPALVALETLDGRNQYEFAPGEEPPWRWLVESVIPPA
jgi:Flp pilus assembly pilin Flp